MSDQHSLATSLALRTLELLKIVSVTGQEQAIANHLTAWAIAQRLDLTRIDNKNLVVGPLPSTPETPSLLLVGHLDTVPDSANQLPPSYQAPWVYGRGATDMKGGLAIMQMLMERQGRIPFAYPVCAIFYSGEEGDFSQNGLQPVLERLPALRHARLAICLEPTDNRLELGCVGSINAEMTFIGQSAHAARPWQGRNAILRSTQLLTHLAALTPKRVQITQELDYYDVISPTKAHGGISRNTIPERFVVTINAREAPRLNFEQPTMQQQLHALAKQFNGECRIVDTAPAAMPCLHNALLQRWQKISGLQIAAKQAWTDVARLQQHGIDAVNFGPGLPALAHHSEEAVHSLALVDNYAHIEQLLRCEQL